MGQQESHVPGSVSGVHSRAPSESTEPPDTKERPIGSTSSVPSSSGPGGRPGRKRMDKLFRRAQSTLESKFRNRDRSGSPGTPKTLKRDAGLDSSSSLEVTPTPSPQAAYSDSGARHGDLAGSSGRDSSGGESVFLTVKRAGDRRSGSSVGSDQHSYEMDGDRSFQSDTSLDDMGVLGAVNEAAESLGPVDDRYCSRPACRDDEQVIAVHKPSGSFPTAPIPVIDNGDEGSPKPYSKQAHSSPKTRGLIGSLHSPGAIRAGSGSPKMPIGHMEEKRPEELQGHLAPIVTTEDLGLSPIEERSDTLSIGSKSNDDISRYSADHTTDGPRPHQNGFHGAVCGGSPQGRLTTDQDTRPRVITTTSHVMNDGASADFSGLSDDKRRLSDDGRSSQARGARERKAARLCDDGLSSDSSADNDKLTSNRVRPPGRTILPDHPFPMPPGDRENNPVLSDIGKSINSESTESSVEPLETSPEEYSPLGGPQNYHYLGLPGSTNSSAFSSPTEELYTDALTDRSQGDSPYVSAAESHTDVLLTPDSAGSMDEQDSTVVEEEGSPPRGDPPRGNRMSQSFIESHTSGELLADALHQKSSSLDNLDKIPGTASSKSHKPVDANYTVATSRLLSSSGADHKPRNRTSSQTLIDYTTPSHSPSLRRRTATGSDQDLDLQNPESDEVFQQGAPLSRSMDSGLESTVGRDTSESFVSDIREARYDFARQLQMLDDDFGESILGRDANITATESEPDGGEVFPATHYNNWVDSDGDHDSSSAQNHHGNQSASSGSIKKRLYYRSQDSSPQQVVSPGTDDGHQVAPLRPPSRSISLSEVLARPENVPDKLEFRNLEKFEGNI